jgi:hypothetical protein
MLAYMLWAPFPPEQAAWVRQASLLIFAAGLVSALLVALDILWRPGVSHTRAAGACWPMSPGSRPRC